MRHSEVYRRTNATAATNGVFCFFTSISKSITTANYIGGRRERDFIPACTYTPARARTHPHSHDLHVRAMWLARSARMHAHYADTSRARRGLASPAISLTEAQTHMHICADSRTHAHTYGHAQRAHIHAHASEPAVDYCPTRCMDGCCYRLRTTTGARQQLARA